MANIVINIDTDKQKLICSVNDKVVSDVNEVHIYKYDIDENNIEYRVNIYSGTEDKDNKICKNIVTSIANNNIETKDENITEGLIKALSMTR